MQNLLEEGLGYYPHIGPICILVQNHYFAMNVYKYINVYMYEYVNVCFILADLGPRYDCFRY